MSRGKRNVVRAVAAICGLTFASTAYAGFNQLPNGCATMVSAGTSGSIFALGCDTPDGYNYNIYQWDPLLITWHQIGPGAGDSISAYYSLGPGNPYNGVYVTNSAGLSYAWTPYSGGFFETPTTNECLYGIASGSGTIYLTGRGCNSGVYLWQGVWNQVEPGFQASRIAVGPDGTTWVLGTLFNQSSNIYKYVQGVGFELQPGCAVSIGVGPNNNTWVVGCDDVFGGSVYHWNGSGWVNETPGTTSYSQLAVAPDTGLPVAMDYNYKVYQWSGPY